MGKLLMYNKLDLLKDTQLLIILKCEVELDEERVI